MPSPCEIVHARVRVLSAPVSDGTAMSFGSLTRRATVLLEIETRDGLVGLGESWVNFPEWAPTERVATLTHGVIPILLNEDARRITQLHRVMMSNLGPLGRQWGAPGPVMQAISAADIALWDLRGKAHGESVASLLGGRVREVVPVYASSLGPQGVAYDGAQCRSNGFGGVKVKLGFGRTRDEATLAEARGVLGSEVTLCADANQAWTLVEAVSMGPLLHEHDVAWVEEPIQGNQLADLEAFYERTGLPVATGENLHSVEVFLQYIASPAVHIVQPDVTKAGGFSDLLAICRIADALGVEVMPHFYGGAVGFGGTLQCAACMPSVSRVEYDVRENPLRDSLLLNGPVPVGGVVAIPDGPGLGLDLDLDAMEPYLVDRP